MLKSTTGWCSAPGVVIDERVAGETKADRFSATICTHSTTPTAGAVQANALCAQFTRRRAARRRRRQPPSQASLPGRGHAFALVDLMDGVEQDQVLHVGVLLGTGGARTSGELPRRRRRIRATGIGGR